MKIKAYEHRLIFENDESIGAGVNFETGEIYSIVTPEIAQELTDEQLERFHKCLDEATEKLIGDFGKNPKTSRMYPDITPRNKKKTRLGGKDSNSPTQETVMCQTCKYFKALQTIKDMAF